MSTNLETALDVRIRTMRIIIFALLNGIVIFMAIAIFLRTSGNITPVDRLIISPAALIFGAVVSVVHWVVPNMLAARARRQIAYGQGTLTPATGGIAPIAGEVGQLVALYQTRLIMSAAFLEGATFFFLIAFMIEGQVYTLLGAILLTGMLALKFPTRTGVEGWIEEQQELIRNA
jgi:hypothetical protein